ncbi:MAG: hypothetical protein U5K30_05870 [Acidimicrobiales bacterium]|nr:hypothetical protein [Acidimicrobiales bacterium]
MDTLSIPRRYCGPPNSANGGYTCGTAATALGGRDVEVKLRAPPPLETPLTLEHDGDEVRLFAGETLIAVARPAEQPIDIPDDAPPVLGYDEVVAAAADFDVDAYRDSHEYPTCYTCGPDRADGDGLRIFSAPTDRPDRWVWPWTPDPSLVDETGTIPVPVVWAALDCPSGQAWLQQDPDMGPVVLGTMAARVDRVPTPGEHLVVSGWTGAAEGRKRPAWSAISDATGTVLATSRTTWVVLDEAQRRAFRAHQP